MQQKQKQKNLNLSNVNVMILFSYNQSFLVSFYNNKYHWKKQQKYLITDSF